MNKPKLMIVEDEAIIAADIEEALSSLNYNVVGTASSGKEALELAREKRPDLILMDIHLDGPTDGIEVARQVREELDVPVVFLTAFADTATFNRAKDLEPQGYVLKPFRQTELRTVIELALHKHRQEQKRRETPAEQSAAPAKIPAPNFKQTIKLAHAPSPAMQTTIQSIISEIVPFSMLSDALVEEIASCCYIESYKNFEVIVHEGREPRFGFLVAHGRVAVSKTSDGGKELVVELLGPRDLFGVLSVVDGAPYPFSARSQGESRVLWIPREVILYILEHYQDAAKELYSKVLDRLRRAHDFSRALAHDKVEIRIASSLLMLKSQFGVVMDGAVPELELTRQELAELVGTTPETISRVLNRWVDEEIVDLSTPGKVRITGEEGLLNLVR